MSCSLRALAPADGVPHTKLLSVRTPCFDPASWWECLSERVLLCYVPRSEPTAHEKTWLSWKLRNRVVGIRASRSQHVKERVRSASVENLDPTCFMGIASFGRGVRGRDPKPRPDLVSIGPTEGRRPYSAVALPWAPMGNNGTHGMTLPCVSHVSLGAISEVPQRYLVRAYSETVKSFCAPVFRFWK